MKFLTIEDVCEMLSISRRTLERMRSPASKSIHEIIDRDETVSDMRERIIDNIEYAQKGSKRERIYFPEPDINIGKSPRWERDKLLKWLEINGHRL